MKCAVITYHVLKTSKHTLYLESDEASREQWSPLYQGCQAKGELYTQWSFLRLNCESTFGKSLLLDYQELQLSYNILSCDPWTTTLLLLCLFISKTVNLLNETVLTTWAELTLQTPTFVYRNRLEERENRQSNTSMPHCPFPSDPHGLQAST